MLSKREYSPGLQWLRPQPHHQTTRHGGGTREVGVRRGCGRRLHREGRALGTEVRLWIPRPCWQGWYSEKEVIELSRGYLATPGFLGRARQPRGKDLLCHCRDGDACHGGALIEAAHSGQSPSQSCQSLDAGPSGPEAAQAIGRHLFRRRAVGMGRGSRGVAKCGCLAGPGCPVLGRLHGPTEALRLRCLALLSSALVAGEALVNRGPCCSLEKGPPGVLRVSGQGRARTPLREVGLRP